MSLFAVSCKDEPVAGGDDNGESLWLGEGRDLVLTAETADFNAPEFTCALLAPDGTMITRQGNHMRRGAESRVSFKNGLSDGEYRLLYFEYPIEYRPDLADLADRFQTVQFGLGSRIKVKGTQIMVCDRYDDAIGLPGSGTQDDPYIISSYQSMIKLMLYVNSAETNKNIKSDTYFKQTNPINMDQACFECDMRYGWLPIGCDTNTPFRGVFEGDELSWLWIDRGASPGVGLFGYLHNATVRGVRLTHAEVKGNFAVGALAGACISAGNAHGRSSIIECSSASGKIEGTSGSFNVGGLVGALDLYTATLVTDCSTDGGTVKGSYNVGGIVGGSGLYSRADILGAENSATVSAEYSCVGGIVGAADTLSLALCRNSASVNGATAYKENDTQNSGSAAGGIAGGTGMSWISASTNSGNVTGRDGVGGIVGSTRVKGSQSEATVFNNCYLRWCENQGDVSGHDYVGGLNGESQIGTYGVMNQGAVTGRDYVGGITGNSSLAVVHNALNTGRVNGSNYISGILGKTTWGALAFDYNYGRVTATGSHTAGVIGLAGNNTCVHYCGNMGEITGGSGPTGGIIAEIGDPRKWTAAQIADCVVGSVEIAMSLAGPMISVASTVIEEGHKIAATLLEVSEFAVHCMVALADAGLASYALYEIIEPEACEELEGELNTAIEDRVVELSNRMSSIRNAYFPGEKENGNGLNYQPLSTYYDNINNMLAMYEEEGMDEAFNNELNLARVERMEELEKHHQTSAIIHEVMTGVCLMAGTVASIGALVASGGAAAPFVLAGSVTAVVGGLNAISKSVMEFEENVVLVTQCVNAGNITSSGGRVAGIVGELQDNGIVSDCLNVGDGPGYGYDLVDLAHGGVKVIHSMGIGYGFNKYPVHSIPADHTVGYTDTQWSHQLKWDNAGIYVLMTKEEIADSDNYTKGFHDDDTGKYYASPEFDLGDAATSRWTMGKGWYPYPVPARSQYMNKE